MFDGPEYASYIQLCRELRLEREIELGDWTACFEAVGGWGQPSWVASDGPVVDVWQDNVKGYRAGAPEPDRGPPGGWTWLPRLDQWLTMLEAAAVFRTVSVIAMADAGWRCEATETPNSQRPREPWTAPTREEAAARLWMAVTGRTVTSG